MKNITTFFVGGFIMLALAPYLGMLLSAFGSFLIMVGKYLETFPSFF